MTHRSSAMRIEEAKRRFARSLVGRWTAAVGTFSSVQNQHWEIQPDGTGRFIDTGCFGATCGETRFLWRQVEDFVIELTITECIGDDLPGEPGDSQDPGESRWVSIRYDFVAVQHDCGVQIGLSGGWFSGLAPLAYAGPPHAGPPCAGPIGASNESRPGP